MGLLQFEVVGVLDLGLGVCLGYCYIGVVVEAWEGDVALFLAEHSMGSWESQGSGLDRSASLA